MRFETSMCAALFTLVLSAAVVWAQDPERQKSTPGGPPPGSPPALPEGMTEEQMWTIPTREDWAKPVLIEFERTWDDAVEVARATGKPLLICINMDGEIASEHYAGIKYRDPEYAKLFEPYVCVIASVYRHTPRDYDEAGNRILCPRLGSVTCGEHIAIEPVLFERYMDERRISPRHIMVELDGYETYDVYFAWDLVSVFTTLREGIEKRERQPIEIARGDGSVIERVVSRATHDRSAVEQAYQNGDRATRERLLLAARANPTAAPVDLLRLGVFGLDAELAKLAREALLQIDDARAVDLIGDALSTSLAADERRELVAALERLGATSQRARLLANVHGGLATASKSVDLERWSSALRGGGEYAPVPDRSELDALADRSGREARAGLEPEPEALVDSAEAALVLAVDPENLRTLTSRARQGRDLLELMLRDVQSQAREAIERGAAGWRVEGVLALCAFHLGEQAAAYEHAIAAMATMPATPDSWTAVATLALFAQARQDAIWQAMRAGTEWPREWMTDVSSAYAVLAHHALGTDQHAVSHYDFLDALGAKGRAADVLREGLARFPNSWQLHDRLRSKILATNGVDGLERAYEAMLREPDAAPDLEWFAGLTSIVAAEFQRRAGKPDVAIAAYDRAISHYDAAIVRREDSRESADHYAALALAGKARIALEREDLGAALEYLLAGLRRHADATDDQDGLGITPAMTVLALRAKLTAAEDHERLAELESALGALDPALLIVPPGDPRARGRGPRRGRGNR